MKKKKKKTEHIYGMDTKIFLKVDVHGQGRYVASFVELYSFPKSMDKAEILCLVCKIISSIEAHGQGRYLMDRHFLALRHYE
jgi:hypothetical protein